MASTAPWRTAHGTGVTLDSTYLLLAERLGAPLATLDGKLATASRNAGVELLIPS